MVRFVNDQNKVVMLVESGTYATSSGTTGQWIGLVESHTIEDSENKMETRYLGTSTRSFVQMIPGPRDVRGTITYAPQDMRIPFLSIGSVVDTSGTNSVHLVTQVETNVRQSAYTSGTMNPPNSFTIEDSKTAVGTGNLFVRTINGCIPDKMTITATRGEKVKVDVEYVGQTLNFSSGTSTAVTPSTTTPYLWNNCSLVLSGNTIQTANEVVLEVNQNLEAPHYLNGSRDISVPYLKNRNNKLSVTLDLDAPTSAVLYNDLYKNNGQFNAIFDLNADNATTGSQHTIFALSGCRITAMDAPSEVEGTTESTIEIEAPILIGSSFDRTLKYGYW